MLERITDEIRMCYGDIHCPDIDGDHSKGCEADEVFNRWFDMVRADAWEEGLKSGLDTGLAIAENVHENGRWLDIEHLPKPEENPYRISEK